MVFSLNSSINAQDVQLIGRSKDAQNRGLFDEKGSFFRQSSGLFASTGYQAPNWIYLSSKGDAGDLTLSTNKLLVQDGAVVSTETFGSGNGGNLTVNAQDVQLIGRSKDGQNSGLFSSAARSSTGDAGNLTLSTNKLLVQDGAVVSAGSRGRGKGGNLNIDAQENVQLIGGSSGLLTTEPNSIVDAGDVNITTDTLLLTNGARIDASTFGEGEGGNLTIHAKDVQLIGRSQNGQLATTLATSAKPDSTGDAGDVNINSDNLQLRDGATITAESQGMGIAGDININIKDNFNADNGQVITQSQQSSGGNINITAGKNIFLRNDSNIRTTLQSTEGSGGNISLTANAIVALEDSDILAFASEGSGGNINFDTRIFFSDPLYRPTPQTADKETLDALDDNNRVDVNASGSISAGSIIGIPNISFVQDKLSDLPANQIDTNVLIANSCIARSSKGQENSFTITGSGGLRNSPVDGFVSRFSTGDVRNVGQISSPWKKGDAIVEATGIYRLADGSLILGQACDK